MEKEREYMCDGNRSGMKIFVSDYVRFDASTIHAEPPWDQEVGNNLNDKEGADVQRGKSG